MLELLSLTSDNDLVLAKIDNYYLCLAEPSKRKYDLNWYDANDYCESLGKDYSLPSKDELNLIYTNKGSLSLAEACLYGDEINTLDFISKGYSRTQHPYWSWMWSSSEINRLNAWNKNFNNSRQDYYDKSYASSWVLPVRRILV